MVTSDLDSFLKQYRGPSQWLDDIVDVLLRSPKGTAHVQVVAKELWKSERRDIDTVEQTVTRCINNFCSDAADFKRDKKYDLFTRVAPAIYRLRAFPARPDTIELVSIDFDDQEMQYMWKLFSQAAERQHSSKWTDLTNRRQLQAFANWMSREESQKNLSATKGCYGGNPEEPL